MPRPPESRRPRALTVERFRLGSRSSRTGRRRTPPRRWKRRFWSGLGVDETPDAVVKVRSYGAGRISARILAAVHTPSTGEWS
ncbi:MAG: hypothetical protein M3Q17_03825 [Actinomycetota bacterium]|nr:hypothetical protein [Actinomycetota bacterium]